MLNVANCLSYACAKAYRSPLLFKGDEFTNRYGDDKSKRVAALSKVVAGFARIKRVDRR